MDVDTDTVGTGYGNCTDGGSRRFFYMQDANWNVTALREGSHVVERYEYDPYGTVRIYKGYDDAAGHELLSVTVDSLKWLDAGLPGNPVLYCGYFRDEETEQYHVRHRHLWRDRWLQRDPAEYDDSLNLYEYARSSPALNTDSSGLGVIGHLICAYQCSGCPGGVNNALQCAKNADVLYKICYDLIDPDPCQGLRGPRGKYPPPTMEDCLALRRQSVRACLNSIAAMSATCARCVKCVVQYLITP